MQYYEFDVYDCKKLSDKLTDINLIGKKKVFCYDGMKSINQWIANYTAKTKTNIIGNLCKFSGCDFQKQNLVHIRSNEWSRTPHYIDATNLIPICIYLTVAHVIPADWLNDRDQFLYPNALWESDKLFHSDCLAYSLFHGSNNIQSGFGINHWIPFSEEEVGASGLFKSSFMVDFIAGKLTVEDKKEDVFNPSHNFAKSKIAEGSPRLLEFSEQATDLFICGKKLWRYYHQEARNDENYLNDASFYDIRKYFQGTNDKGHSRGLSTANPLSADLSHNAKTRMNNKSSDAEYNVLLADLRKALKTLGDERIVEKVFEYGFLLK